MAVEPVSYRINLMIAEADEAIRDTDTALEPVRRGNKPVPKELLSQYYRLHQHRHALELQRIFPQAVILTDIQFTSIMDADGKEIQLRVKKGEGRIADAAIVYGDRVWLIEAKVLDEVLRAFPAKQKLAAQRVLPGSTAGTQFANEQRILKQAGKKGVLLGTTGVPVLGGPRIEVFPEVDNITPSRLQKYKLVDGPQVPQAPPTTSMVGTPRPLRAIDIVATQPAPTIQAVRLPPPPPLPPRPPSTGNPPTGGKPPAATKTPTTQTRLPPGGRGGVLQGPVPIRGHTANATGDRANQRPQTGSGRGRWQWPTTTGGGTGFQPQAGTTVFRRARSSSGGVADAVEQISHGISEKRNQIVFDRARSAAAEPDVFREVQRHRNSGNWVKVEGVFWHSQPTIAESADVRFHHIQLFFLSDPQGQKDEESARNGHWYSLDAWNRRSYRGEQRNMPKNYHASSLELNLYAPEPEFEYFDEDIPVGRWKMGRCVRHRLR